MGTSQRQKKQQSTKSCSGKSGNNGGGRGERREAARAARAASIHKNSTTNSTKNSTGNLLQKCHFFGGFRYYFGTICGTGNSTWNSTKIILRQNGPYRADYFDGQQVIWDLAGTGTTLFSGGLFWDRFFLNLGFFFRARFRSKLMYYNLYHTSDLRKIVWFLRKIECIEFECSKFVLVLVQIDLIHFEQSNCISSTWTKTNTDPLHSRSILSILCKIGHVIQIVVHQFVCKTISTFKLY
jgi:hypothetical protein